MNANIVSTAPEKNNAVHTLPLPFYVYGKGATGKSFHTDKIDKSVHYYGELEFWNAFITKGYYQKLVDSVKTSHDEVKMKWISQIPCQANLQRIAHIHEGNKSSPYNSKNWVIESPTAPSNIMQAFIQHEGGSIIEFTNAFPPTSN